MFFNKEKQHVLKFIHICDEKEYHSFNLLEYLKDFYLLSKRIESDNSIEFFVDDLEKSLSYSEIRKVKDIQDIMMVSKTGFLLSFSKLDDKKHGKKFVKFSTSVRESEAGLLRIDQFYRENLLFFDWGYSVLLKSNYDLISETNINWFTSSNKTGIISLMDCANIIDGYIPRLYRTNYLNKNQMEKLQHFILGPAINVKQVDPKIWLVELSKNELREINARAKKEKFHYLIHSH